MLRACSGRSKGFCKAAPPHRFYRPYLDPLSFFPNRFSMSLLQAVSPIVFNSPHFSEDPVHSHCPRHPRLVSLSPNWASHSTENQPPHPHVQALEAPQWVSFLPLLFFSVYSLLPSHPKRRERKGVPHHPSRASHTELAHQPSGEPCLSKLSRSRILPHLHRLHQPHPSCCSPAPAPCPLRVPPHTPSSGLPLLGFVLGARQDARWCARAEDNPAHLPGVAASLPLKRAGMRGERARNLAQ